jgi:hypothetical protein
MPFLAGRRTQVAKGAVCKTAMQRFEPARRLQTELARAAGFAIVSGDGQKILHLRSDSGDGMNWVKLTARRGEC